MRSAIFALLALAVASHAYKYYDGYQVLRTEPLDRAATESLKSALRHNFHFTYWHEPRHEGDYASIMAAPDHVSNLKNILNELGVKFEVQEEDVGIHMRNIEKYLSERDTRAPDGWFDDYRTYQEITDWLNSLPAQYAGVSTQVIGQSYEGRDMTVLKIEYAGAGAPNVWIEAGIHAREWISPAVAQWIIDQLLETTEGEAYTNQINFYVLVNANPDGYDYTFTTDRLWRKTRSPQVADDFCITLNQEAIGVDPNRNFDYHWGETGVSPHPCEDSWPGTQAFSEAETQNIRDFVSSLNPVPTMTFAMHSAANLLLFPYSWNYPWIEAAENAQEQQAVGNDAVAAINAANSVFTDEYTCINSALLYPAAGDASDFYYELGARFAYLIELRDEQRYGFELPPEYIIPSGEETWEGFKVLLDAVLAPPPGAK